MSAKFYKGKGVKGSNVSQPLLCMHHFLSCPCVIEHRQPMRTVREWKQQCSRLAHKMCIAVSHAHQPRAVGRGLCRLPAISYGGPRNCELLAVELHPAFDNHNSVKQAVTIPGAHQLRPAAIGSAEIAGSQRACHDVAGGRVYSMDLTLQHWYAPCNRGKEVRWDSFRPHKQSPRKFGS